MKKYTFRFILLFLELLFTILSINLFYELSLGYWRYIGVIGFYNVGKYFAYYSIYKLKISLMKNE